jgi:hypothetical protein
MPGGPTAGNLVDEAIAGVSARLNRGVEIGNPVADMMDARPPASQEFPDGTVRIGRSQQFYSRVSEGKAQDGGSVYHLGWIRLHSQDVAVEGNCRLEIWNGNTDMGDAGAISH